LHWCTSKASKLSTSTEERRPPHAEGCQNLYWCTSKASKLSTSTEERRPPHARLRTSRAPSKPCPNIWVRAEVQEGLQQLLRCQYLYFCTSNASIACRASSSSSGCQYLYYLYVCTSKLSKTEYLDCARVFALHCFVERALAAQSGAICTFVRVN
jgi:hypothetical protein